MRLDLNTFEAIRGALLEVPVVVDHLEASGSQASHALEWLRRIEMLLASKRLPVAARIAAHRAMLVAARRGRIHGDLHLSRRPTASRIVVTTAALAVERAVSDIGGYLEPEESRFREAARLALQLVTVSRLKGIPSPDPEAVERGAVATWIESASGEAELAGGLANLTALVGREDATHLLSRGLKDE